MAQNMQDLRDLSNVIFKQYERLKKSRSDKRKYDEKKENFLGIFYEKKQLYLVYGIACIIVLFFDYFVSHETLQYLARLIRIPPSALALIFSFLDGALAILASGGLAGSNMHKKELQKKTFGTILVLLGIVKLILFGIFTYDSYLVIDSFGNKYFTLTWWEFIKVLLPQTIFVIIVYSVLTFAGIGLFYIVGIAWFALYGILLENPVLIEKKIRKLFLNFRDLEPEKFEDNMKFYNLHSIHNDVNQIKDNLGVSKYEQN